MNNHVYLMKINQLLLLLYLFSILQTSCTERNRFNPIDPDNPITQGKPQGLHVISKMDTVILSWEKYTHSNLTGYELYRCDSAENELKKIATTSPMTNIYYDYGMTYDVTYSYQVRALTKTYESRLSDPVQVRPGPTYNWILESESGLIIKLTHDAQSRIFGIYYSGYPEKIVVNPVDQTAWVTDNFLKRIYHISNRGKLIDYFDEFDKPADIDAAWHDGSLWLIAQSQTGLYLKKLNRQGRVEFTNDNFNNPAAVRIDQKGGFCWIADTEARKIFRMNFAGEIVQKLEIFEITPQHIAVFYEEGSCWAADSLKVYKIYSDGREILTVAENKFVSIAGLDIDQKSGACWILDRFSVFKLDANGATLFMIDGFYYPRSLAVNSYNGSCVVADTYRNRAVIISADGKSTETIPDIKYPWDVCVEYFFQ